MKRGLGRGRLGCPRPAVSGVPSPPPAGANHDRGYSLLELLLVLWLVAVLAGVAAGAVLRGLERARGLAAARYLAARMTLARAQASTWGAAVALRFEETQDGPVFSVYRDGNRNGVRSSEIVGNVDRQVDPPVLLSERFPGVRIGLAPGAPVVDPVHIGITTLLSFSPLGTATSGTIYIVGSDRTQWAVRVLGATGRTRVLRHDPALDEWSVAF